MGRRMHINLASCGLMYQNAPTILCMNFGPWNHNGPGKHSLFLYSPRQSRGALRNPAAQGIFQFFSPGPKNRCEPGLETPVQCLVANFGWINLGPGARARRRVTSGAASVEGGDIHCPTWRAVVLAGSSSSK